LGGGKKHTKSSIYPSKLRTTFWNHNHSLSIVFSNQIMSD